MQVLLYSIITLSLYNVKSFCELKQMRTFAAALTPSPLYVMRTYRSMNSDGIFFKAIHLTHNAKNSTKYDWHNKHSVRWGYILRKSKHIDHNFRGLA